MCTNTTGARNASYKFRKPIGLVNIILNIDYYVQSSQQTINRNTQFISKLQSMVQLVNNGAPVPFEYYRICNIKY